MEDVLVVGAGIAGLTAAAQLQEAGVSVQVTEARDRVGGRTFSRELNGETIDLGGQWLGPTQNRALALAERLGVRCFAQHSEGRKVVEIAGRRRTYRGLLPAVGAIPLAELAWVVGRLELMARRIDRAQPHRSSGAERLDQQSLEDWLQENVRSSRARAVIHVATNAVLAAEPKDLSLLYFLFYMRSGGGFIRLTSIDRGAQQWRLAGGAMQLSQRLAASLEATPTLSCPVRAIEQSSDFVTVAHERGTTRARRVVVALPPAPANDIEFAPALPQRRRRLLAQMPMGCVVKCVVAYRQPFWREDGLSGEAISHDGLVRAVFDDCSEDGSFSGLVAFVLADRAKEFRTRAPDDRRRMVVQHLVSLLGPDAADPIGYVDKDWAEESWSGGCYVGFMPPGLMTALGDEIRKPAGRIHFAGTETAERWCGYIEGAIESGERVAREIIARSG